MLSREDAGEERPLFVFPGGPCPTWEGDRMGSPGCSSLVGFGCWGGAEVPGKQGAVLHHHPAPGPSESVLLLFQLKRKQERLPLPCHQLTTALLSASSPGQLP